ncbi:hypothetical protein TSTA_107740 [Talaromyces stipitatus ATCC 10500]|uniref:Uncharacterized protein n=1 Tax=Talaromyces stipitatus (strain ATCC 10500 / CBS 375.48 / QM 6759 / NRRL 1006) TaxID=441959 RepID=B8MU79_TALSN|nr:uncharacterized protein TSTA_107740 [Talaromyces stipitatus ATCC 10500]EED11583.1 hypothetical protein TSTA_107740 [Talaromyces stipitatus ATCC 10500]
MQTVITANGRYAIRAIKQDERRRKSPSSVMKEVTVQETSSAPALFESNLSILPSGQPNLQDPGMMGHTGDAIHPNYLMEEPQLSGEKFMYHSELPYPYVGVNCDSKEGMG